MDSLASIRSELRRYRRLAELALEQVEDRHLGHRPDLGAGPVGNSIGVLIQHLAGNLRSRYTDLLTSDGEKPWRDRDGEFEERGATRAELLADWTEAWALVEATLDELGPGDLGRAISIRGQSLTVAAALERSLAHAAYHVGQLCLLARGFAGERWRSLSIPPGGSAAYATDPTRELGPDGRSD